MSVPAQLTMTMNRPDGTAVLLYKTVAGREVGPAPVAVGDGAHVVVEFGRPSPRDHADASHLTVTIDQPADTAPVVVYDARLVVRLTVGGVTVTLGHGWVEGWTREHIKRTAGDVHRYHIRLVDVVGRAAAWKIGDVSRPTELASTRAIRVNAITGQQLVSPLIWATARNVGPRDIDNLAALDVLHKCCPAVPTVMPTPDGLHPLYSGKYVLDAGRYVALGAGPEPVTVPTSAVQDKGDELTRAGRVTQIAVEQRTPANPAVAATTTYRPRPDYVGPTSQHRIDTDVIPEPKDVPILLGMLAAVEMVDDMPAERIDAVQLLPTRLVLPRVGAALAQLLDEGSRMATPIYLEGPARRELNRCVFITAGRIEANGNRVLRYDVTLTPGDIAGVRPLRWIDLNWYMGHGQTIYTFNDLRTLPYLPDEVLTFRKTLTLRLTYHWS